MSTEEVRFFSGGVRIAGTLKLPETGAAPWPAVVQGPGEERAGAVGRRASGVAQPGLEIGRAHV